MAIPSIRLKHRDLIMCARAGEELAYFRTHGYTTLALPGLSSALAVRSSFELCTRIGRHGKVVSPPSTDRTCTVLALVCTIARPSEVGHTLVTTEHEGRREGPALPGVYPIVSTARCQTRGYSCDVSMPDDVKSALAVLESNDCRVLFQVWCWTEGRRGGS